MKENFTYHGVMERIVSVYYGRDGHRETDFNLRRDDVPNRSTLIESITFPGEIPREYVGQAMKVDVANEKIMGQIMDTRVVLTLDTVLADPAIPSLLIARGPR